MTNHKNCSCEDDDIIDLQNNAEFCLKRKVYLLNKLHNILEDIENNDDYFSLLCDKYKLLNDENLELIEGEGITEFFKRIGNKVKRIFTRRPIEKSPRAVRGILDEIGDEPITSLTIVRTPLSGAVKALINIFSLGKYNKIVGEGEYDKYFHLALLINNKYTLDKQAVVTLVRHNPITNESEVMPVNIDGVNLTIRELYDNGKEYMGNRKWNYYNALENNCQSFVSGILLGNDLMNDEYDNFINQSVKDLVYRLPTFTKKVINLGTYVGAVADKLTTGEGVVKKSRGRPIGSGKKKISINTTPVIIKPVETTPVIKIGNGEKRKRGRPIGSGKKIIKIEKGDFIAEHKNLIKILSKGNKKQRQKELQDQTNELIKQI